MEIPMILWIGWRFLCCFHLGSLTQLEDPKLEVLRRAALHCHQAQPLVLAICWWLGPLTLPLILRKLGQLLKWGLQGCIPRGQRGNASPLVALALDTCLASFLPHSLVKPRLRRRGKEHLLTENTSIQNLWPYFINHILLKSTPSLLLHQPHPMFSVIYFSPINTCFFTFTLSSLPAFGPLPRWASGDCGWL